MSNGIQSRQNEDNSISMLAAQRQIYSEAKKEENIIVVFSVLLPFFCACIQIFVKDNTVLNTIVYIFPIISMVVGIILEKHIEKEKEMAAFIQQKFDVYVYQMPWEKRLFGVNKNVSSTIAEKSNRHLSKDGTRAKLENWYTPRVDTFPIKKGILECQKENFYWDVGLRKRYKVTSIILIIVLSIIIFSIGIVQDEKFSILVYRMTFVFPLVQWLNETVKSLSSDIRRLEKLNDELSAPVEKSMEDLQDIQKEIFDHRKSCRSIPNFFYQIFKNNDEDKASRTAEIEVKSYENNSNQ